MCRWTAYIGPGVFLEDIVTAPEHSLIAQSREALEAHSPTNGDGFGLAWYGERPEPGLYRSVLPAWSDPNLTSVCRQIQSRLFLAHVRASTGGATSLANCHPFVAGRWSFMHNGQVGGFDRIKRWLENSIADETYAQRQGTTDSELLFLMMIDEGLATDPLGAAQRTVHRVVQTAQRAGVNDPLKVTAAFSDGETLYAIRYGSDGIAPTLYASETVRGGGLCLASEPFDRKGAQWRAIPQSSFVVAGLNTTAILPFEPGRTSLSLAG